MESPETRKHSAPFPPVSIITALYNCLELTRRYLETLEATLSGGAVRYEVILVDDGSTDGTREFLETLEEPYRVLLNKENLGYAGANNRGAEVARNPVLIFLNNDLELQEGWLEPMLKGLEFLPDAGIVGNIQFNPKTGLIDHAGVFFDREGLPAHARKGRKRIPRGAFREWNAVTAACMVIRADVFREHGGFDGSYHNGTEDIDLCVRLKESGFRHYVSNESRILHHVSSSPGRTDRDQANMELFKERWGSMTSEWGKREWAQEYLRRYARRWWRYNFTKFWRALWILLFRRRSGGVVALSNKNRT